MNCFKNICLVCLVIVFVIPVQSSANPGNETSPRIVHIVNFIRQLEPRDSAITEDVLYETVRQQALLSQKYKMPTTFLLQYDALINPRYQKLLKEQLDSSSEVGGWWEITQPHAEAAGLKWRGRYPWDWHANVGFSTGYSIQEREKLVDVYMEKFKSIFGRYPTAIASWFIDEHSLAYMYDKYHILASGNCKDQIGTDGYTLWGGYWNQAYYPSRSNAYMPAQTAAGQIGVPVFRLLGSDPVYQYDSGLGEYMGVETMEPIYPRSGGSHKWVEWLLKSLVTQPCLSFGYTQAGQENSFTWDRMKDGLEMQFPIIDSLRKANKLIVETMSQSGSWFKNKFALTPATSVTVLDDYREEGNKTVWYNSRFYRVNLLWKGSSFRFRDVHLFDEKYKSAYYDTAGTSTQCIYTTLPVLDGFSWSTPKDFAGLRIMKIGDEGKAEEIQCNDPVVTEKDKNVLQAVWKTKGGETFKITFFEDRFEVDCQTSNTNFKWALELKTAPGIELPFRSITENKISASLNEFKYELKCSQGSIQKADSTAAYIFRMLPNKNKLVLNCNTGAK